MNRKLSLSSSWHDVQVCQRGAGKVQAIIFSKLKIHPPILFNCDRNNLASSLSERVETQIWFSCNQEHGHLIMPIAAITLGL